MNLLGTFVPQQYSHSSFSFLKYFMPASREPPIANVIAKDFHVTGFERAARGRERGRKQQRNVNNETGQLAKVTPTVLLGHSFTPVMIN